MKVMHIISGGDTGGAKTSVITLLLELKKIMDIKLVCFMEGEFAAEARKHNIDLTIMKQSSRLDLSVTNTLVQMINKENFDLVNCHGARANFIGAFLKHKIRVPLITTVHSDYTHDFDNSIYKKVVFTMINKQSLKKMDAYITMSERLKGDMIARGIDGEKTFVAYNGIPIHKEHNQNPDSNTFFQKYGLKYDEQNVYIGTAARLHPIKGIDVLLKAARIVKRKNAHIKFLIAGDGDEKYYKRYKEYVNNHDLNDTVSFLGFVENIDWFYNILDINTITSHSEGFCYALLEGANYALPSVASRVGGIPELINHNINGLLFEDNDYKELANQFLWLVGNKEEAKVLGNNLKMKVEKQFSDKAMANRYYEIYNGILERTKK